MNSTAHVWLVWFGCALAALAMVYSLIATLAVRTRIRAPRSAPVQMPPVTLLKPLCGAEPETYACLRSFCDQNYPEFQIVFGVCQSDDPALSIVNRLQAEFPHLDVRIAIDRRQHGSSRKVSNLINMMEFARHDYFVLSDSDVLVATDYLAKIVQPICDPGVGIVTCSYRGIPRPRLWSILGSLFINEWFMPSVRVAALTGSRAFAFGASIGIRRQVLANIGGFAAIANQLADDYRMGELTRRAGLRTVLSEVVVDTFVAERSFGELVRHELRWLRTIRTLRPWGYAFSFITFGIPVAAGGALLSGATAAFWMLALTTVSRVLLHLNLRRRGSPWFIFLALPFWDALNLGLWSWSFVTRCVQWRDDLYRVTRDGAAHPVVRI